MLLVYNPEDGDEETFQFDLERMLSVESEILEDVGGTAWATWEEYKEKLARGSFKAKRALLWLMLKRKDPRLSFASLVVRVDELSFRTEEHEQEMARKMLERGDLSDDERAQLESLLDEDAEPSPVTEPDPEADEGKGEGGDSDTSSP